MNSKTTKALNQKVHPFRRIPQVDRLIQDLSFKRLIENYPRSVILDSIHQFFKITRQLPEEKISEFDFSAETLSKVIEQLVCEKLKTSLRRVVNATGVILHTGLGRTLLGQQIEKAMKEVSSSYSNLEINLLTGKRQERSAHIEPLLCALTGAEAGFTVNNNAACLVLALNTFANQKEVVISRGQLVEIGGSFRLPEIIQASGVRTVEVGTTNRTFLSDYENAITKNTAVLLRVHLSNFKMVGFTEEVEIAELVKLAKKKKLLTIDDLGSGALIDLSRYGLPKEPMVQESIACGADLVTFSGDKLLGGPQAGIIVGKRKYIERMKKNPLSRALRIDKFRLAALEATLKLYFDEKMAVTRIPVLEMLLRPLSQIEGIAVELKDRLAAIIGHAGSLKIIEGASQLGGGAMPGQDIPTKLVSFSPHEKNPNELSAELRLNEPPILVRIYRDEILIDPRTLNPSDIQIIEEAFQRILKNRFPQEQN